MKFRITLKNPDHWSDSVNDAVRDSVSDIKDEEEREACEEIRREKIWDFLERWVDWKEYVTLETDTEAGTLIVLKAGQD